MDNTHSSPLSPPKHILAKLTPVSPRTPSRARRNTTPVRHKERCYSNGSPRSKRVLSPEQVHAKVMMWKVKEEEHIRKKRYAASQRMLIAEQKRCALLEERRETARRFSDNAIIWNRYKFDIDFPEDAVESAIEDEDGRDMTSCPPSTTNSYTVISEAVHYHIIKRKFHNSIMSLPISTLLETPYEEIQHHVQSPHLRTTIKLTLCELLRAQDAFPGVPLENVFLSSLLLLSDHTSNQNDKVYDARLGPHAEAEFGGYLVSWMRDVAVLKYEFFEKIKSRMLVLCRKMIVLFQYAVCGRISDASSKKLKFLNCWRRYCDLFRLFQVLFLTRCLLLLMRAMDTLQSGIAIQEHVGVDVAVEHEKLEEFKQRKNVLVRQLAQWKRNSKCNDGNRWCFVNKSLKEKCAELSREFDKSSSANHVSISSILIPPGFTIEEWEKFRLEEVLDHAAAAAAATPTVLKMKTGRDIHQHGEIRVTELELKMERIGMTSFRQCVSLCSSVDASVDLSLRLFGSASVTLKGADLELVENGWRDMTESEYFKTVQSLYHRLTQCHTSALVTSLRQYLGWWRRTILGNTQNHVSFAMESTTYSEFALQMSVFTLSNRLSVGVTLEDYIYELPLELLNGTETALGHRKGLPVTTLVVERLLSDLRASEKKRKRSSISILMGDCVFNEIKQLYDDLYGSIGEGLLFLLATSTELKKFDWLLPEVLRFKCHRWSTIMALHWKTFGPIVYNKIVL